MHYYNKLTFSRSSPALNPPPPIPVAQQFSVPFPQIFGFESTDLIRDKVQAQAPDEVKYKGSAH